MAEEEERIVGKPYLLILTNFRATNLIIADLTSSDPYIIISLNGVEVGKTSIQYKNLNPVWEEIFRFDLIDCVGTLSFQVYDYDDGKELGDFMGSAEVSFEDNMSNVGITRPLEHADKGVLCFDLTVQVLTVCRDLILLLLPLLLMHLLLLLLLYYAYDDAMKYYVFVVIFLEKLCVVQDFRR